MSAGDPRYLALLDSMRALHIAKASGYAGDDPDVWTNFREANRWGVSALDGALVRMGDKYRRAQNVYTNPANERVGEALRETLVDLAAYALIAVCLLDERLEPPALIATPFFAAPIPDAVPAAPESVGEASGAPADQRPVLDGGSVKPATVPPTVERLAELGHAPKTQRVTRPAPGPGTPLTDKQAAIIAALRASGGVQSEAARVAGKGAGAVSATIFALRATGRMPADLDALVVAAKDTAEARQLETRRRTVRQRHEQALADMNAREAQAVREIAQRSREAEPDASAHAVDFTARAKAKADATWAARHPGSGPQGQPEGRA